MLRPLHGVSRTQGHADEPVFLSFPHRRNPCYVNVTHAHDAHADGNSRLARFASLVPIRLLLALSPTASTLQKLVRKVARVTGAGAHPGRAISETLLEHGCAVFLANVDGASVASLADELNNHGAGAERVS